MKIITYYHGTRHEYSIAVTQLDTNRVLLTGMPKYRYNRCNGVPTYETVIVDRLDMGSSMQAKADIWMKCGVVGHRKNNAEIVPAICEILDCPNPGIFSLT
jgi:hypothetical protein